MIKIYVADLAKYNEGILAGKWFDLGDYVNKFGNDLDILEDDIADMLDDNEECAIHDYDVDVNGLGSYFGEYPSLADLLEVENMLHEDEDLTKAIIEYFGVDDLLENGLEDYRLMSDVYTDYDLGYYYIEDAGIYNIPDYLSNYIDYGKFGRDIAYDFNGGFTSYGFIEYIG